MRLWFLCCVVLFGIAQGYDWVSQQPWFGSPHLALHWIILGGLGLAIASNRSTVQSLITQLQERRLLSSPPEQDATPPQSPSPWETSTSSMPAASPELSGSPMTAPPAKTRRGAASASISFEITKKR